MPETREFQSVIDAGVHAASAGDYAAAEAYLREAVRLQEADSPLDPELANTLNNLGVVCEITEKPEDAEACYRRAYAIATAVLRPDHPFVTISRKNLSDLCQAQGKPVDAPTVPADAAETSPSPDTRDPEPQETAPEAARTPQSPEPPAPSEFPPLLTNETALPPALRVVATCALVLPALIAGWLWFSSTGAAGSSPESESSVRAATAQPSESIAVPEMTTAAKSGLAAVSAPRNTGPSQGMLTVVEAQICTDLATGGSGRSQWECRRPNLPIAPGPVFFYTRLKSATDTTVQHRWYRGDTLRQVMKLRIRPNPAAGYRTYSRSNLDNRNAGNWRVELRTEEGTLLREERFTVR